MGKNGFYIITINSILLKAGTNPGTAIGIAIGIYQLNQFFLMMTA